MNEVGWTLFIAVIWIYAIRYCRSVRYRSFDEAHDASLVMDLSKDRRATDEELKWIRKEYCNET